MAKNGIDGPLAVELKAKRALAEDALAREVAPLDGDLDAWLSFLCAWRDSAAPFEMLSSAGLGINDLARLQRTWARRMEADEALRKAAAERAPHVARALPPLRVAPAVLRPFPWSPRAAPEPAPSSAASLPAALASPMETSMAPGNLRLFAYVAIKARLAESPGREAATLEELKVRDFAMTDAEWQARLREDPTLLRDYRRLLDAQRSKLRARGPSSGDPATPAPARSSPSTVAASERQPQAQEPSLPASSLRHAGTSLALDPPRGAALPFAKSASAAPPTPAPPPAASAPRTALAGTSLAVETPARTALPFAGPSAASRQPRLAGTSLAVDVPAKAALPFAPKASRLTLQQHASLSCELNEAPAQAKEILARYGLTPAEKAAVDQEVRERFAREPDARPAWEAAYQTYRGYLASRVTR